MNGKSIKTNFLLSVAFFTFLYSPANSQVFIQSYPQSGFQMASRDFLQFDVIYNHSQTVNVQYTIRVNNEAGGPVVELTSTVHTLVKGVNSYSPLTFKLTSTRYIDLEVAKIERSTGYLPPGNYKYCITVQCVDAPEKCKELLPVESGLTHCSSVELLNVTPLLLSSPSDEAELEETRPNFLWIPPMPIGNDPDISYQFTLVHMRDDQSAEDAIRRNRALYSTSGIKGLMLVYPSTLGDLEKGEKYAWQVTAFIGRRQVATSQVWEFKIKKEEDGQVFVRIQTQRDGVHTCKDVLRFIYEEPYTATELQYRILDETGGDVTPSGLQLPLGRGENKLEIRMDDGLFEKGVIYTLVVINSKGKETRLRFTFS